MVSPFAAALCARIWSLIFRRGWLPCWTTCSKVGRMTDTQHYRDKWATYDARLWYQAPADINALCDRIDALEAENADLRAIECPEVTRRDLTPAEQAVADELLTWAHIHLDANARYLIARIATAVLEKRGNAPHD